MPDRIIHEPTVSEFRRMALQLGYEKVVRCKDCKHSKPDLFSEEYVVCSPFERMMPCDGFCCFGKREEETDASSER